MEYKYSDQKNTTLSEQERILLGNSSMNQEIDQLTKDLLLINSENSRLTFDDYNLSNNYQPRINTRVPQQILFKNKNTVSNNRNELSEIEAAILRSNAPIDLNETEEIIVNGQKGVWINKSEILNWRGELPLAQYPINDDPNPEIILKKTNQNLLYQQEIAIRYLRPPTPPPPGPILIQQEPDIAAPPAPPLVIRQQPARPTTPPPLVIREAPPQPPPVLGKKIITISGKQIPPPPRKVIIERLAPLPSKPQSIIIERWLPYRQVKRKVIFSRSTEKDSVLVKPKNVIVEWQAPQVKIEKEFKDLGIVRANPTEYVKRYGTTLKRSIELPPFVKDIKPPTGLTLAADSNSSTIYELEGDIHALNLVDLEREGLVEYRYFLKQLPNSNMKLLSNKSDEESFYVNEILNDLLKSLNLESSTKFSLNESERILVRLFTKLGKRFGEEEKKEFFRSIDLDKQGRIDISFIKRVLDSEVRNLNI